MAFKMKGHTLPGINQRGNENLEDGRSKSSEFQDDGKKTFTGPIYENREEANEANVNTNWGLDDKKTFNYKVPDENSPSGFRIEQFTGHKKQMQDPQS